MLWNRSHGVYFNMFFFLFFFLLINVLVRGNPICLNVVDEGDGLTQLTLQGRIWTNQLVSDASVVRTFWSFCCRNSARSSRLMHFSHLIYVYIFLLKGFKTRRVRPSWTSFCFKRTNGKSCFSFLLKMQLPYNYNYPKGKVDKQWVFVILLEAEHSGTAVPVISNPQ